MKHAEDECSTTTPFVPHRARRIVRSPGLRTDRSSDSRRDYANDSMTPSEVSKTERITVPEGCQEYLHRHHMLGRALAQAQIQLAL